RPRTRHGLRVHGLDAGHGAARDLATLVGRAAHLLSGAALPLHARRHATGGGRRFLERGPLSGAHGGRERGARLPPRRASLRRRLLGRVALAFVAGCAVGFVPVVARNLAVGAPPLSFSTRAIEIFLDGNAVDSDLIGLKIPAATRTVLEQADGHLVRVVRLTV